MCICIYRYTLHNCVISTKLFQIVTFQIHKDTNTNITFVSFARPRDICQFSPECDFSITTFVFIARGRDLRQFIPVHSNATPGRNWKANIFKIEGKDFLVFAKHVPQFGIHCRLSIYGRLPTAGPTS